MKKWIQENQRVLVAGIIILVIHIILILIFGMQKEGFHEDELYSFTTSSGIKDIAPSGNYIWKSGYQIQQEFMVIEGEEFLFDKVIWNQSQDVHPPLYYLCLNIVMSLLSNRFYKWFGIGLNLLFSMVTYFAVIFFFYNLDNSQKKELYALIAGAVYAISPITISNIMLTRMYALSSMWTMLYACLFLMLMKDISCSKKRYGIYIILGAVICYMAFLTHYFALLLPFCFTLSYCIYVAVCRRVHFLRMLIYGMAMVVAIVLAIISYPASWQHIFHGYRGQGTFDLLLSKDLFSSTKTFLGILNENMFSGLLYIYIVIIMVVLVAGIVRVVCLKNISSSAKLMIYNTATSIIGCIITTYFLTRTALLVGADSCRFFYPVMVLMVPLAAYCVCKTVYELWKAVVPGKTESYRYVLPLLSLLVLVPGVIGFAGGNVLFLYKDNASKKTLIQEYQQYPAIVVYDSNAPYRSWYMTDQLWMFPQVFYLDSAHFQAGFQGEIIQSADKLVVYVDAPPEYLDKLKDMNSELESIELLWKEKFFFVYGLE